MVFLGSSPFQAPAIYTLMSHLDFRSGVLSTPRHDEPRERYACNWVLTTTSPITPGMAVKTIIIESGAAVGIQLEDGRGTG